MANCSECAFREELECSHIGCAKGGELLNVPYPMLVTMLRISASAAEKEEEKPYVSFVNSGVLILSNAILGGDGDWPQHFAPAAIHQCEHFKSMDAAMAEVADDAQAALQKIMKPV